MYVCMYVYMKCGSSVNPGSTNIIRAGLTMVYVSGTLLPDLTLKGPHKSNHIPSD